MCGYYDLKYIFEIMYYMYKNNLIIDYSIIKQYNNHFAKYYFNDLEEIMNKSRIITIQNINNIRQLVSLQKEFVGYNKTMKRRVSVLIDYQN